MLRRSWRLARYTTSSNEVPRTSETPLEGTQLRLFPRSNLYRSRNPLNLTAPPRAEQRGGGFRSLFHKTPQRSRRHVYRDQLGFGHERNPTEKVSSNAIELASVAPRSEAASLEPVKGGLSTNQEIRPGLGGSEECLLGGLQSSLSGPATQSVILSSPRDDQYLGITVPQTVLRARSSHRRLRKARAATIPLQGRKPPVKAPTTRYKNKPYRNISLRPHNSSHGASRDGYPEIQKFAKFNPRWLHAYSIINAIHRCDLPAPDLGVPRFVLSFSFFVRRVQRRTKSRSLLVNVRKLWISQNVRWKRVWWQPALLYCLLKSPLNALRIAKDICTNHYLDVPSYVLSDVFDHVVSTEIENVPEPTRLTVDLLLDSVSLYLKRYAGGRPAYLLHQRPVCILFKHCDAVQLDRFAQALHESQCVVETDTQLHMITRYVQLDRLGQALEILWTVPTNHLQLDAVQSVCCLILRAPWEVDDLYGLRCRILSYMLEHGISPNKYLRNVVLLNAMEAGDRAIAWQSYAVTKRNGLLPDPYTYSILLQGVQHGDDLSTINSIYQESKDDGNLMASPFLAEHMMWAIYSFYHRIKKPAFKAMLSFYTEVFDVTPLYELGLLVRESQLQSRDRIFMQPTSFALAWLLIAWIQENSRDQARLREVYDRYIEHTTNGNPRIAPLASQTFVSAFFIFGFGNSRSSLQMCTTVAQNLLRPPRPAVAPTESPSQSGPSSEANSLTTDLKATPDDKPLTDAEFAVSPGTSAQYSTQEDSTAGTLDGGENFTDTSPASSTTETSFDTRSHYEKPPPLPLSVSQPSTKDYYHVAPPNVYIWNALLHVFAKHRQLDAAERIMTLMRGQNVEPNKTSWDTLVWGYARAQNLDKVVATVELMGKESFIPDAWTLGSLSFAYDRRGLQERFRRAAELQREREMELEKEDQRKREEFAEFALEGLEEREELAVVAKEEHRKAGLVENKAESLELGANISGEVAKEIESNTEAVEESQEETLRNRTAYPEDSREKREDLPKLMTDT